MIKVEVPRNKDFEPDIVFSRMAPPGYDRPYEYFKHYEYSYGYLKDIHHQWFKYNNIKYDIFEERINSDRDNWYIIFENESDAILFKLTWGGR